MTDIGTAHAAPQPSGAGSKAREIVLTEWVTVDGFTAGPGNDMSFVGESFDEEMSAYEEEIIGRGDTLLLGRVTYDSFAGSWPRVPENPEVSEREKAYARILNAMRKIVVSSTMEKAEWNNSIIMREIDKDMIEGLKREGGKDVLIYGSASIVQRLTRLGLIDEYQLLVHPVVVGSGKRLFESVEEQVKLTLVGTKTFTSGVMLLTYRPVGRAGNGRAKER